MTLTQWVYEEINPSTYKIVSKTYGARESVHKTTKSLTVL